MKSKAIFVILTMGIFWAVAVIAATGGTFPEPAWESDYDRALDRACRGDTRVLMLVTNPDYCPPCRSLEEQYLSRSAFAAFMSRYDVVLLKVDTSRPVEKRMSNRAIRRLQRKYHIRGIPTMMLIDKNGRELARIVGYGGKNDYERRLSEMLKNK